MTLRLLLISSILFSGLLKADVDFARLPASWIGKAAPATFHNVAERGPTKIKSYYVSSDAKSTITHLSGNSDKPFTTTDYEQGVNSLKDEFPKQVSTRIVKNEEVEHNGVRLLHQETEANGMRILLLTQICPDKVEQVMLTTPPETFGSLAPQAYNLFLPVAPLAEPSLRDKMGSSYQIGGWLMRGAIVLIVAVVLGKLLVAAAKQKPKRKKR